MNLIQRATTKLKERLSPRGLILMYHRVAETDLDPWGLSVSPTHFAEQLEVIKRYFQPLSLQDLLKQHEDRRVPNRSIAITFDDGYADNLHMAKPLLEHYDVAATVFLVTEVLTEKQNFWWDELTWALLQPETLPGRLEMKTHGKGNIWDLDNVVQYSMNDRLEDRKRRPWDALPGTRLAFFYLVWEHLIQLCKPERLEALETIRTWAGVGKGGRTGDRALSRDEVIALGEGGLIELGAHTVTHPALSTLSVDKQFEEIRDSRAQLEEITGCPVTSFSYPHGDYSSDTATLVHRAGFSSACTTQSRSLIAGADRFQLPRFQVDDWNGDEFLRRLIGWYIFS